jgi:hypothetical protein
MVVNYMKAHNSVYKRVPKEENPVILPIGLGTPANPALYESVLNK